MWNGSECKWVKRNGDRLYLGIYNRLRLKTKADVLLTNGVSIC